MNKIPEGYKQTEVGVIPEDWDIDKLERYFSYISYGFTNPMPNVDNGIFLITATDINHGKIQYQTTRFTSESAYQTSTLDMRHLIDNYIQADEPQNISPFGDHGNMRRIVIALLT